MLDAVQMRQSSTSHRYSEWLALRNALPPSLLPAVPFPPKRFHCALCEDGPGGRRDHAMAKERAAGLHAWAAALLSTAGAVDNSTVRIFFVTQARSSFVQVAAV